MSPLVAGLSGKAADAVAASWKGRQYVRKHVIPRNPNTIDQQAWRANMARMGKLFRSLPQTIRDLADLYGSKLGMSGYNWMSKANLDALFIAAPMPAMPGTPAPVNALSVTGVAGAATKQVLVTAVAGAAVGATIAFVLTAPTTATLAGGLEPDVWTVQAVSTITLLVAGVTYTLAQAAKTYHVAVIVISPTSLALMTDMCGGLACIGTTKV